MNDSNSSSTKKENSSKSSKYECLDCENYKRKVKEAEQSVSGRDVLIEMLQGEIKKMEDRYKISIDDYELLRFKYCTAVQELGYFKEIHKKLEKSNQRLTKERDNAISQVEILQREMDGCQNQCKAMLPKSGDANTNAGVRGDNLHQNILKEVMNIEVIIQNQNETVNDALQKVLSEMGGPRKIDKVTDGGENIKDKNKEDLLVVIEDLKDQISKQNIFVEKLKAENETIKSQLTEKKTNLVQCLGVLEDNHLNLNSLSGSIEKIIKEKDTYLKEVDRLKDVIQERDMEIENLKKLSSTRCDINLRNENEELHKALNDREGELEQLQELLKNIDACTPIKCQSLAKAIMGNEAEGSKNVNEDKKEITDEDIMGSNKYKNDVAVLNDKIEILEKNLEQVQLLNRQYKKESQDSASKINNLKEKTNLRKSIEDQALKDQIEQIEKQISDTEREKTKLMKENDYVKNQLIQLQNEIMQLQEKDEKQILTLQEKINALEHSEQIKQEEINQCCCVVKNIQEAMEKNNSVQIQDIENQNITLQEQNKALQDELQKYQKLYNDCECTTSQQAVEVNNMESAVEKLKNDTKELEIELCKQECLNEKLQNDVSGLEIEICRRQCTISHLEQCLDQSNEILLECEREMKEMHSENENLKKENESLQEQLKSYVSEVHRSSMQNDNLQEKLNSSTRQSQQLENENIQLLNNLQAKAGIEDDLKQTQEKYNNLVKANQQKDDELKEAKKLIDELESKLEQVKAEQTKIKQAYKEVQDTLSEEIKKFNEQTGRMNNENFTADVKQDENYAITEFKNKLAEKEKVIEALEAKNQEFLADVLQHKGYVTKLISDNNTLRKAVDKMLATLGEKLRNFSGQENGISHSNEAIMQDILESLIDLEKSVTDTGPTEKCNCMSVIKSTYKGDNKEPQIPPCKAKCGRLGKEMSQYIECAKACKSALGNTCEVCCMEKQENAKSETLKCDGQICDECENLPSTSKL